MDIFQIMTHFMKTHSEILYQNDTIPDGFFLTPLANSKYSWIQNIDS